MNKKLALVILAAAVTVPTYILAQTPYQSRYQNNNYTNTSSTLTFDDCMVPVYHTNFAFPPQGGVIIDTSNGMYFVRTYLPGCENAASGYTIIKGSGSAAGNNTINYPTGGVASGQQPYQAPPTGIKRCN